MSTLRPLTSFSFTQDTPASVWTIQHDMLDFPVVDVYITVDDVVNKVIPKTVAYPDNRSVVVTFTVPHSGFATLVA